MKFSYSPITFTSNPAENTALLQNRDYHTLCVVQDCFGTINGTALAGLAARGETFTVNPAWDCGRGEAWFRAQSAREFPAVAPVRRHRIFKVVARSSNLNSFGLRQYILLNSDGETWRVCRSDFAGGEDWQVGNGLCVNLNPDGSPRWHGMELPHKFNGRAPAELVAKEFGK